MTINWLMFWAIPIMGMGLLWKRFFQYILMPIYVSLESNKQIRSFAATYVYTRADHADFFIMSVVAILNSIVSIGFVFYWQLNYGNLPAWVIFAYYCSWVGIGGRIMGAAYSLAHKEV
jgi:hypothetical protein